MFCCTLLYVHSCIAIILMGKRELIAFLNLSSWCLVMVKRLFLAMPRGCLQFVMIVVFPDHTHLLFFMEKPGIEPAPGLQCICLSLIQKTGKIQVNYIQVLVTTPNMEKTQKVFIYLFIFFFKKNFFVAFQYWAGRVSDLCVFLVYDGNSRRLNQTWFYGEAGNRTCDPWFTRHSFCVFVTLPTPRADINQSQGRLRPSLLL